VAQIVTLVAVSAAGCTPAIRRVIVGSDDSPAGLAALAAATDLATSAHAELVAMRALGARFAPAWRTKDAAPPSSSCCPVLLWR
jgi:hypothetical protein